MSKEYVVREVMIDKTLCWTVVEYEDGQPHGGDAHWLTRQLAETAKTMYETGQQQHGRYWWGMK